MSISDSEENDKPWENFPGVRSDPVSYNEWSKSVRPFVFRRDFWAFYAYPKNEYIFFYSPEFEEDREKLKEQPDWDKLEKSFRFISNLENWGCEPQESPLFLTRGSKDGGPRSSLYLYRFLDGGYALTGTISPYSACLEIVPLSSLVGYKVYRNMSDRSNEETVEMLSNIDLKERVYSCEAFQRFCYLELFHFDESNLYEPLNEEIKSTKLSELYRSSFAAAIHRAAEYFRWAEDSEQTDSLDANH